jgi:radical SAM protein with 4Fe4S-binding SPASM domain
MPKYLESQIPKGLDNAQCGEVGETDVQTYDLQWIDGFIKQIKPYIYVREHDHMLILVPNQAFKLNESGVQMLQYLIAGHATNELLRLIGDDVARCREIHYFFCDLRAMVSGCVREQEKREAIDYYEFSGDFNTLPVLSEIAVTYRCNLHCDFCYVGRLEYGELKTSDLKRILFKIYHEAKVPSVSFTGGEPLLRQDIVELVAHASELGLWTNLITNGTLADKNLVRALKDAGLSSAQVSIEGSNAHVHDRITGVNGSFDATKRGITSFRNASIPVHTNTTISRHNLADARQIVLFAKELGLTRLSMNLLIPCGSARERKDMWVSYSEIGEHIIELKQLAEGLGLKYMWYSPLPMCRFNTIAHGLGNKSCAAITGLLSIDPMGNVIPCSSWRKPVGSLLRKSFSDIWQSEALRFYKNVEYAPRECIGCDEFTKCKGACPLYWQACGNGELNGRE